MNLFADQSQMNQWVDAFLRSIPYAREAGMHATDAQRGHATVVMPGRHDWTGDSLSRQIHPGCATVLADTACGVAVGTALEEMVPFATLDLRMDYLRPAQAGASLTCVAHCHRISRHVAFVRGEIFQGEGGEPVATVNATFMLGTSNRRRDTGSEGAAAASPAGARATEAPGLVARSDWDSQPAVPVGRSPYVDFLGLQRCTRPDDPTAVLLRMPFQPVLIGNPVLPALHGGVVAGFAESAAIVHLMIGHDLPDTTPPRGVDFSLDYLRPARPVDTWAQCTTVRQGARVALVHIQVWQDDPTRPIVLARSHCLLPQG